MKPVQWAVVLFGIADLILTAGYLLDQPWALHTWPWQDLRRLDYLLVASFLAGATAVILWVGFTGEWRALAGAAMNVGLMNAGSAIYLFGVPSMRTRAVMFAVFALVNAIVLVFSLRTPQRDRRPIDRFLRGSLGVFWVVLLYASIQLFRRSPTIFPWTIEPEVEVMIGWLFFGSTAYFAWGFFRPSWHNARGQLLAFLAYDIVLLPRYLLLFSTVEPDHLPSLIVYVIVLVYSSALAIYYLFINPKTRGWAIKP